MITQKEANLSTKFNPKIKEKKNFPISDLERQQLIAERAFLKAERRHFDNSNSSPEKDWFEAEKEINSEVHFVR